MDLERHIAERVAVALPQGASVCAGLSGGLDSVVLVELLARAAAVRPFPLSAVHVHHGLSPNADAWASFCQSFCEDRAIPIGIERVRVERSAPEGLEAAARKARYAVFASRTEDLVALAHHLDDQAETVLLQILRGTGLKGAAAMPGLRSLAPSSVRLFRPLIDVPRAALESFAKREGLRWVEDESNVRHAHGRNFLRHEIAPRLDARFPAWQRSVVRFARHAAAADALLHALAVIDGLPSQPGEPLHLDARLPPERRANLLREYLALNEIALPSEARLEEISRQLFQARPDARVRIDHEGVSLVRYRQALSLDRGRAGGEPWHRPWHGEAEVDLGPMGLVRFEASTGEGLSAARLEEGGWHFAGRSGGERMRTHPRRPTRSLKNLLQEHAIAPWKRPRLPLLFHRDALVWVPGVGIAVDYACAPGEPGLVPRWTSPG